MCNICVCAVCGTARAKQCTAILTERALWLNLPKTCTVAWIHSIVRLFFLYHSPIILAYNIYHAHSQISNLCSYTLFSVAFVYVVYVNAYSIYSVYYTLSKLSTHVHNAFVVHVYSIWRVLSACKVYVKVVLNLLGMLQQYCLFAPLFISEESF